MTTATEPPLITPAVDVSELPALDQPDERACELTRSPVVDLVAKEPCPHSAAWAVTCTCTCDSVRVLICEQCRKDTRYGLLRLFCFTCESQPSMSEVEPL